MFVNEMGLALLGGCKCLAAVGLEALGGRASFGTVLGTLAILARRLLRSSPMVVRRRTMVVTWRLLIQDIAVGAGVGCDLHRVLVRCCGYLRVPP